jgi:hypothetical protein
VENKVLVATSKRVEDEFKVVGGEAANLQVRVAILDSECKIHGQYGRSVLITCSGAYV